MIWLIGGTSESRMIARSLSEYRIPWVVTVVTSGAVRLYRKLPGQIWVGQLTDASLAPFLREHQIHGIVDASHPFAIEISQLALSTQLPYLRFERPTIAIQPPAVSVSSFSEVLTSEYLEQRRVLLTVGVKALPQFAPWQDRSQLWARILPNPEAMQKALLAGFQAARIVQMRLPITFGEEQALWSSLNVDTAISKASGSPGGLQVKQQVARALGIRLIVIERPTGPYPQQTSEWLDVLTFCHSCSGLTQEP